MKPNLIHKILIKMFGFAVAETHWMPYGTRELPVKSYFFKCKKHGVMKNVAINGVLRCPNC